MENYPLIRKIYLYLFTLVGLSLMVIGGVRLLDLGMKMTIFKQAEREQVYYDKMPPYSAVPLEKMEKLSSGEANGSELTVEEKEAIGRWVVDYKNWEERQKNFDPLTSRRQRDASNSLAMIIIGLPLYLYHWSIIKKETKKA